MDKLRSLLLREGDKRPGTKRFSLTFYGFTSVHGSPVFYRKPWSRSHVNGRDTTIFDTLRVMRTSDTTCPVSPNILSSTLLSRLEWSHTSVILLNSLLSPHQCSWSSVGSRRSVGTLKHFQRPTYRRTVDVFSSTIIIDGVSQRYFHHVSVSLVCRVHSTTRKGSQRDYHRNYCFVMCITT